MLNAALLWFLPLILVPVILHLITLYRLRTVELSTFRFLMDSYIQQRRRIKLLEWLIMLLRVLFVALLVFTLARPVLQKFNLLGGSTGRDVTIVLDAGASMALRAGSTTSMERAKEAAKTVVGMLRPDDHVTLIRAEEKPTVLYSGFANAPDRVIEQVNGVTVGISGANMAAALEDVFTGVQRGSRIVYVITDAGKRAWAPLATHPTLKAVSANNQLVVMNVGPTEPVVNLSLVGDPPRPLHTIAGLPVPLTATIVNTNPDKPAETTLTVFLDDEQIAQYPLTLQPGQRLTRTLSVVPSRPGVIRGRFQLPADAFPDDDSFLFCLNVEPKLNVLLVTPPPQPSTTLAFGQTETTDTFIRTALIAPLLDASGGVAKLTDTQKLAASLQITSLIHHSVTDQAITAADVIVLCDVPLDGGLALRLQRFVSEGGGLLVLPGPNTVVENFNLLLLQPPLPAGMPARVINPKAPPGWLTYGQPQGDPDDESRFQALTAIDVTHPILAAFARGAASIGDHSPESFASVRLYRYFPLNIPQTPISLGPNQPPIRFNALMRLPDRTPVLVETGFGQGKLIAAAFSPTPYWSSLPLKPEFVPLMLRTVAYLRKQASVSVANAVQPHEPAPLRVTDRWSGATAECLDPQNKPTTIKLTRSGGDMVGAMMDTNRKGYYRFTVSPRSTGAPERVELGFAVNLDVTQADMAMLSESQLRETLRPASFTYLRGSADDPVLRQQLTEKSEIWRTLLWAMFIIMGAEFLLSTLSNRRQDDKPAQTGPRGPLTQRLADALLGSET